MNILNTIRETSGVLSNEQIGTLVMNTSDFTPYELGRLIRVVLATEAREVNEALPPSTWQIEPSFYDAFDKYGRRTVKALARINGQTRETIVERVTTHDDFELSTGENGTEYVSLAKKLR